ncbi:MAG: 50S ribosomal protein L18 [Lentisphaeria bacterium]
MAKMTKKQLRVRKHLRLRRKVSGTAERPRMSVYRSNQHIQVQFINDDLGVTITSASTLEKDFAGKANVEGGAALGTIAAERALKAGITEVIFDRGGYKYHGKVKAVADAAREAGLKF